MIVSLRRFMVLVWLSMPPQGLRDSSARILLSSRDTRTSTQPFRRQSSTPYVRHTPAPDWYRSAPPLLPSPRLVSSTTVPPPPTGGGPLSSNTATPRSTCCPTASSSTTATSSRRPA